MHRPIERNFQLCVLQNDFFTQMFYLNFCYFYETLRGIACKRSLIKIFLKRSALRVELMRCCEKDGLSGAAACARCVYDVHLNISALPVVCNLTCAERREVAQASPYTRGERLKKRVVRVFRKS
jgi:hypothetical protein